MTSEAKAAPNQLGYQFEKIKILSDNAFSELKILSDNAFSELKAGLPGMTRSFSDSALLESRARRLSVVGRQLSERATSASIRAREAYKRYLRRWLVQLPTLAGLVLIAIFKHVEISDATLRHPHQLGQTANFGVTALAWTPVAASGLYAGALVRGGFVAVHRMRSGEEHQPTVRRGPMYQVRNYWDGMPIRGSNAPQQSIA